MHKKGWFGYLLIVIIGGGLFAAAYAKFYRDYDESLEYYKTLSRKETQSAVGRIEGAMHMVYRNLRLVSFVPAVRAMDMQSPALPPDTLFELQQVFNNLVEGAGVSELYVTPSDPGLAGPALAFDREAADGDALRAGVEGASPPPSGRPPDPRAAGADGAEEYRLLREQAEWFRENTPALSAVEGIAVPVISGLEVATRDSSVYRQSRRESDRAGIIFSVPLFAPDGGLKGMVSAVILSHRLRELLPAPDYAIVNAGYDYVLLRDEKGRAALSRQWVEQARADPALLYSEVLPLGLNDPRSKWYLWAGHENAAFYDSHDVRMVRSLQYASFGAILAVMALAAGLWASILRQMGLIHRHFEGSIRTAEESSRTKFDFLATRTHTLNPLIGEIAAAAEDMANDARLGEEHREKAAGMLGRAEALSGMVSDISDFLTIGAHGIAEEKAPFNVRDVLVSVTDMLRPQAQAKKLELELDFNGRDDFPVLVGDPMPLGRVFANLVGNAIRYTTKGFVRVDATVEKMDGGRALLCVDIVDSGPGIPFERQKTLFDKPGAGGNASGGLGLVICRTLVELMEGEIKVESAEGVGSTFSVRIPFEAVY